MLVPTNKFTLDRFASYSSDLTNVHRNQIDSIATSIENSFHGGGPRLSMIKIKGHAAFYDKDPDPEIPYVKQGRNRAEKVRTALNGALRARRLERLVEIWSVSSAGTDDPVTRIQAPRSRARNRRVEVELSQIDTKLAPWRWICRLEVDFGQDVYNPYTPFGDPFRKGIGTGVLISERHILTSAHNVAALRKSKGDGSVLGSKYRWVGAKKIRVSPGWIGGGEITRSPFGTRSANLAKTRLFPGFAKPFDHGDYTWDGKLKHQANFSKSAKDLAIIEVERGFSRRPLWWGQTAQFSIGIPNFSILTEIANRGDKFIRTAGFGDPHNQLMFSKGMHSRYRNTGLLLDDDISTSGGHSGSPHWARDGSGGTRLIAIHMGDNQALRGDVAVALARRKTTWINRITR